MCPPGGGFPGLPEKVVPTNQKGRVGGDRTKTEVWRPGLTNEAVSSAEASGEKGLETALTLRGNPSCVPYERGVGMDRTKGASGRKIGLGFILA